MKKLRTKNTYALTILIVILIFTLISCSSDGETLLKSKAITCDKEPIINDELLIHIPSYILTINNVDLVGDCLKINFTTTGCNVLSKEIELISSSIMESEPPQRILQLSLKDDENCGTFITKDVSFNISDLREGDNGRIIIDYNNNPIFYGF